MESKLSKESKPMPLPRRTQVMQARMALQLGRASEALRLARGVLQDDQNHLGALEVQAQAEWKLGCSADVVRTVNRLIKLNPYEPGYQALKASALQTLGRYGEAAECFAKSRTLPQSETALRELESWQAGLVRDLLEIDPVFKVSYARDPQKACEAKGFRFFSDSGAPAWRPTASPQANLYTRPS